VTAFRSDRFHVRVSTNNGIERQNRALKHDYLVSMRDRTLSDLVTVLVEKFHPDAFRKYVRIGVSLHCALLGVI